MLKLCIYKSVLVRTVFLKLSGLWTTLHSYKIEAAKELLFMWFRSIGIYYFRN